MSHQSPSAPNADCLHGTVDGLPALIWQRREQGDMKWCWISKGVELLRTHDGYYVGICDHKHGTVGPIVWRNLNPSLKVVLVNHRPYPWDYLNATRGMNDNLQ